MPAPVISPLARQRILVDTAYRQTIRVTGGATEVDVDGLLEGFHYDWDEVDTITLIGNPERLLTDKRWTVTALNADGTATPVIVEYDVVPPQAVIQNMNRITITRGEVLDVTVPTTHLSQGEAAGLQMGLYHEVVETGIRIYGTPPPDAVLTKRNGEFRLSGGNASGPAVDPDGNEGNTLEWEFPPEVPSAPTIVFANGVQGGGRVLLRWTTPLDDGGSPILRYEYRVDSGTWTTTGSNDLETTIAGLTDLQSYTFEVQAVNRVGASPASNLVTVTPRVAVTVPTVPRSFAVTARDSAALIEFMTPLDDGGTAILRYEIQRGTARWTDIGLVLSHEVTGLTNGQSETFKVRAVNAEGNSPATAPITVIPRRLPDAPRTLTAVNATTAGDVDLAWLAPLSNGGLPILRYEYRIGGATGTWTTTGSTRLTFTVTGLLAGTFTFEVRAVTAEGASVASNVVSLVVTGPTAAGPSAPQNLRIRINDITFGNSVFSAFAFDAPANLGFRAVGTPSLVRYEYRTTKGQGTFSSNNAWTSLGTRLQTEQLGFTTAGTGSPMIEVRAVNNNPTENLGDIASLTWNGSSWS